MGTCIKPLLSRLLQIFTKFFVDEERKGELRVKELEKNNESHKSHWARLEACFVAISVLECFCMIGKAVTPSPVYQ